MSQANRWDERYSKGEHVDYEPAPLVVEAVAKLAPGAALDLACGAGRNALFLAQKGWRVTAVDYSRVAIEILQRRAAEQGVAVDTRVADLERREFAIARDGYDLICDYNYLQRNLFAAMRWGVRQGGLVVCGLPMLDEDPDVKPMNPAYLVGEGELRSLFNDWTILHYYEGKPAGATRVRPIAEIVARREAGYAAQLGIRSSR